MAVVAFLAVNLAAFRAALSAGGVVVEWTAPFVLIGSALLVAMERLAFGRRDLRPFWAGFLVMGASAALCLLGCLAWPRSFLCRLWEVYLNWLDVLLGRFPQSKRAILLDPRLHFLVVAAYFSLPQIALAFVGGMATQFVGKSTTRRSVRRVPSMGSTR
jgi:hypothetical protein